MSLQILRLKVVPKAQTRNMEKPEPVLSVGLWTPNLHQTGHVNTLEPGNKQAKHQIGRGVTVPNKEPPLQGAGSRAREEKRFKPGEEADECTVFSVQYK
jgi:hypothetical protein